VIEVDSVSKRYGNVVALDSVSLAVAAGEVVGLLGPNGAGKTTLIRAITGFHEADRGAIRVGGHDVVSDSIRARAGLGYLPENASLYDELTPREHLEFAGEARGLHRGELEQRIDEVADLCRIADELDRPTGQLSKGFRQRTGLAMALLPAPNVYVLDEPMSGLDPNQITSVRDIVRNLGREASVLLSTHTLREAELLCDRVVIINNGRVVADLGTHALGTAGGSRVVVSGHIDADSIGALEKIATVADVRTLADRTELIVAPRGDAPETVLFDWAVAHGQRLIVLEPVRRELEDVFAELTRGDAP
jgi:ABC-2 type transport system ATP-binding protein